MLGIKNKKLFYLLIFLFFADIFAWLIVYDFTKSKLLNVTFFDVGEGDAIFIETPQRHQILIDGGPDVTILEKLAKEMPFWDRTIDLVILTHPERDHLAGLIEVLKSYQVKNILWTGVIAESLVFKEWLKRIKLEGAKIYLAKAGQKVRAGECLFFILSPFENLENQKVKHLNDTSIVTKFYCQKKAFFFAGDIFQDQEEKIIENYNKKDLDSDILKVAHHGSKSSTSQEFLEIVSPEIAVISVGKNNYGHPHQEVLEKLERIGAQILRTDREGDIKIKLDGSNFIINTQKYDRE